MMAGGPERMQQLDPGHPGHLEVGDHERVGPAREFFQSLDASERDVDGGKTLRFEEALQGRGDEGVIVNHQNGPVEKRSRPLHRPTAAP
jgi:hypothetical protein